MTRRGAPSVRVTLLLSLALAVPRPSAAQGVAGAAIQGTVVSASGSPVSDVSLSLVNASTGHTRHTVSNARGRFTFEYLSVGGPYALSARAIGFAPVTVGGISLHLGDRLDQRLVLAGAQARVLEEMVVRVSSRRDAGAGGPAHSISGDAVRALPLLKRDFVGLLSVAPQATGSGVVSVSGQHSRYNSIQVDGGSSADFFGTTVTPGAGAGARVLSIEAVEEIRVLVAPFDVRQGGFSGGLINAVNRSGTNQRRGSAFVSGANERLVGADTAGEASTPFTTVQYGALFSGPLIRDRLHYFIVADLQAEHTPFTGPAITYPELGFDESMARRVQVAASSRYGFDPGGIEAPVLERPNGSVFAKLSWKPASAHLLELTTNWVNAQSEDLGRTSFNRSDRDGWQLSRSGLTRRSRNLTNRVRLTSVAGAASNELIASVATYDVDLASTSRAPLFLVQGNLSAYVAAGSVKGAQDTQTDQRIIEMADNLTWSNGAHLFTVGTQNHLLHFRDTFVLGAWGTWTFASVDSFERGVAKRYDASLPAMPGAGPLANFSALELAGYVEDRWSITPRLAVTAGLRYDIPFSDAPPSNSTLRSTAALGSIDTGEFPSGNGILSPRVSFWYEAGHAWRLRGGAGGFAGRAPYAWAAGAFSNTGIDRLQLACDTPNNVPSPTGDITALPRTCLTATGVPLPSVTYFERDYRFPQAMKYDLGTEHDFSGGLTASFDVMYVSSRNSSMVVDANLIEGTPSAEGRAMYGTVVSGTRSTPTRRTSSFGAVYRFENTSADRAFALTAELQKRWNRGGLLQVGYNWSRSEDVSSTAGFAGSVVFQNNPIDGTMAVRALRRSSRDIPHNLVVTAIGPLPFSISASAVLRVHSGIPYAYTTNTDTNGDGVSGNDLAYVPRDASDVSLTNPTLSPALDTFIASEPCLREQRGHVMRRNSCRNPWVEVLDARLAKTFRVAGAHDVELKVDIFNLLNLLNTRWGVVRETPPIAMRETLPLLNVAGWDARANRPLYTIPPILPSRENVVVDASRWRMQLGARVDF